MILWPLLKKELPLFHAVILTNTLHAYPPLLRRLQLEKSLTEMEAQVELQLAAKERQISVKDSALSEKDRGLSSLQQRCGSLQTQLDTVQRRNQSLEVSEYCK